MTFEEHYKDKIHEEHTEDGFFKVMLLEDVQAILKEQNQHYINQTLISCAFKCKEKHIDKQKVIEAICEVFNHSDNGLPDEMLKKLLYKRIGVVNNE
jgi:L-rhamnose mutarotase